MKLFKTETCALQQRPQIGLKLHYSAQFLTQNVANCRHSEGSMGIIRDGDEEEV